MSILRHGLLVERSGGGTPYSDSATINLILPLSETDVAHPLHYADSPTINLILPLSTLDLRTGLEIQSVNLILPISRNEFRIFAPLQESLFAVWNEDAFIVLTPELLVVLWTEEATILDAATAVASVGSPNLRRIETVRSKVTIQ